MDCIRFLLWRHLQRVNLTFGWDWEKSAKNIQCYIKKAKNGHFLQIFPELLFGRVPPAQTYFNDHFSTPDLTKPRACSIKVSSHLNIICRSLEVKSAPKKDEIWLQVALLTLKEPGKLSRLFGTLFLNIWFNPFYSSQSINSLFQILALYDSYFPSYAIKPTSRGFKKSLILQLSCPRPENFWHRKHDFCEFSRLFLKSSDISVLRRCK